MRGWLPGVDDALIHLLEKPGDGAAHTNAAALVHVGVDALDLGGPDLGALPGGSGLGRRRPQPGEWEPPDGWHRSLGAGCGAAPGDQEEGLLAGFESGGIV